MEAASHQTAFFDGLAASARAVGVSAFVQPLAALPLAWPAFARLPRATGGELFCIAPGDLRARLERALRTLARFARARVPA